MPNQTVQQTNQLTNRKILETLQSENILQEINIPFGPPQLKKGKSMKFINEAVILRLIEPELVLESYRIIRFSRLRNQTEIEAVLQLLKLTIQNINSMNYSIQRLVTNVILDILCNQLMLEGSTLQTILSLLDGYLVTPILDITWNDTESMRCQIRQRIEEVNPHDLNPNNNETNQRNNRITCLYHMSECEQCFLERCKKMMNAISRTHPQDIKYINFGIRTNWNGINQYMIEFIQNAAFWLFNLNLSYDTTQPLILITQYLMKGNWTTSFKDQDDVNNQTFRLRNLIDRMIDEKELLFETADWIIQIPNPTEIENQTHQELKKLINILIDYPTTPLTERQREEINSQVYQIHLDNQIEVTFNYFNMNIIRSKNERININYSKEFQEGIFLPMIICYSAYVYQSNQKPLRPKNPSLPLWPVHDVITSLQQTAKRMSAKQRLLILSRVIEALKRMEIYIPFEAINAINILRHQYITNEL